MRCGSCAIGGMSLDDDFALPDEIKFIGVSAFLEDKFPGLEDDVGSTSDQSFQMFGVEPFKEGVRRENRF